jgi:hypothetical protein
VDESYGVIKFVDGTADIPHGPPMVTDMLKVHRHSICVVALALAGCVTQSNDKRDVDRFVQRRALCDHFSGELPDPAEKARMDEVIKKANEACAGTDSQLKALKSKYALDAEVMTKLRQYEDEVE